MPARVEWLIVGAGLTGATLAERIATELGERVLVVERRDHIAGNAYDHLDEHGLLIHRYGPHIFHTNSERVWAYLNRFTAFRPYQHRVLAAIDGQLVPVPFNFRGIDAFFGGDAARRLKEKLVARYGRDARVPILKLREDSDGDIRRVADFVYDKVFAGYTAKQWGLGPEQLSPSVTARVPVAIGDDDRYFTDRFQGIPVGGYTAMVARMLDHPAISVSLKTDFRDVKGEHAPARVIYTGPIDAYFDRCHGALPYRSVRFEKRVEKAARLFPAASINYPNEHAYTRETEIRQITGQDHEMTAVIRDYPLAHEPGKNEPYYPVINDDTRALLARYRRTAEAEPVIFAGRLGEYRYYDMDQAVATALATFSDLAARPRVALP
jgi:UDP-galactopyranose mutase